ncbi:MAG: thioesterase family protein [Verrucomicrobiota bacterium]
MVKNRVEYAHTDMAGIVHFSEFFRYMEAAEHAFYRSVELSVSTEVDGQHVSWPRVSCSFDFEKPLRFEDEFEIHLTVERLGNKSVTFKADVMRDGERHASGKMTNVCCEIGPNGPIRAIEIPEEIRKHLKEVSA